MRPSSLILLLEDVSVGRLKEVIGVSAYDAKEIRAYLKRAKGMISIKARGSRSFNLNHNVNPTHKWKELKPHISHHHQ